MTWLRQAYGQTPYKQQNHSLILHIRMYTMTDATARMCSQDMYKLYAAMQYMPCALCISNSFYTLHTAVDASAKTVQPTYAQAVQDMQYVLCLTFCILLQHRYLNQQRASKFGYEHLQSIRYIAQLALVTATPTWQPEQHLLMTSCTVISVCNNCFGSQELWFYIDLSLLSGTTAVIMQ